MPANAASLLLLSWENKTASLALHTTNPCSRLRKDARGFSVQCGSWNIQLATRRVAIE